MVVVEIHFPIISIYIEFPFHLKKGQSLFVPDLLIITLFCVGFVTPKTKTLTMSGLLKKRSRTEFAEDELEILADAAQFDPAELRLPYNNYMDFWQGPQRNYFENLKVVADAGLYDRGKFVKIDAPTMQDFIPHLVDIFNKGEGCLLWLKANMGVGKTELLLRSLLEFYNQNPGSDATVGIYAPRVALVDNLYHRLQPLGPTHYSKLRDGMVEGSVEASLSDSQIRTQSRVYISTFESWIKEQSEGRIYFRKIIFLDEIISSLLHQQSLTLLQIRALIESLLELVLCHPDIIVILCDAFLDQWVIELLTKHMEESRQKYHAMSKLTNDQLQCLDADVNSFCRGVDWSKQKPVHYFWNDYTPAPEGTVVVSTMFEDWKNALFSQIKHLWETTWKEERYPWLDNSNNLYNQVVKIQQFNALSEKEQKELEFQNRENTPTRQKIVICCGSLRKLRRIMDEIAHYYPTIKSIMICSQSSDKIKRTTANPDLEWANMEVIAWSPSIQCGLTSQFEGDAFVYVYPSQKTTPPIIAAQMGGRIRMPCMKLQHWYAPIRSPNHSHLPIELDDVRRSMGNRRNSTWLQLLSSTNWRWSPSLVDKPVGMTTEYALSRQMDKHFVDNTLGAKIAVYGELISCLSYYSYFEALLFSCLQWFAKDWRHVTVYGGEHGNPGYNMYLLPHDELRQLIAIDNKIKFWDQAEDKDTEMMRDRMVFNSLGGVVSEKDNPTHQLYINLGRLEDEIRSQTEIALGGESGSFQGVATAMDKRKIQVLQTLRNFGLYRLPRNTTDPVWVLANEFFSSHSAIADFFFLEELCNGIHKDVINLAKQFKHFKEVPGYTDKVAKQVYCLLLLQHMNLVSTKSIVKGPEDPFALPVVADPDNPVSTHPNKNHPKKKELKSTETDLRFLYQNIVYNKICPSSIGIGGYYTDAYYDNYDWFIRFFKTFGSDLAILFKQVPMNPNLASLLATVSFNEKSVLVCPSNAILCSLRTYSEKILLTMGISFGQATQTHFHYFQQAKKRVQRREYFVPLSEEITDKVIVMAFRRILQMERDVEENLDSGTPTVPAMIRVQQVDQLLDRIKDWKYVDLFITSITKSVYPPNCRGKYLDWLSTLNE